MGCLAAAPTRRPGGGGGAMARAGRRKLRAELTTPTPVTGPGCDCARCRPAPLNDVDAGRAVRHVPAAALVDYALSRAQLVGCVDCEGCGAWVPQFIDVSAGEGNDA